jgi:hypothetical protein
MDLLAFVGRRSRVGDCACLPCKSRALDPYCLPKGLWINAYYILSVSSCGPARYSFSSCVDVYAGNAALLAIPAWTGFGLLTFFLLGTSCAGDTTATSTLPTHTEARAPVMPAYIFPAADGSSSVPPMEARAPATPVRIVPAAETSPVPPTEKR